jgi:IS5 family transposase
LQQGYEKLLSAVGRVVGQAKRFSGEIAQGVKRSADVRQQAALEGFRKELDTFVPRVQQVMRQAKQRIFGGDTHVAEKLVSIFEPATEIIRKGKASKPTEFGKGGIYLTQVAPTCSMAGYGRIPAQPEGV